MDNKIPAELLPGLWMAKCSQEQAQHLAGYDHHRVDVDGQPGILLAYPWMGTGDSTGSFEVGVVFHPGDGRLSLEQERRVLYQHPPVPPEIQQIVNSLHFEFTHVE